MKISRLDRKGDLLNLTSDENDMFSGFLNTIKKVLRVSEEEFNYIKTNITDSERMILFQGQMSFSTKRDFIKIVETHLTNFHQRKFIK